MMRRSLSTFLIVLAGLSSVSLAHATTAVFDPTTHQVVVQGIAKTKTITVSAADAGPFSFTDVDCGTITLNLQCGGSISVKCGDPVLGEVPNGWTFSSGSYVAEISQVTGNVLSSAAPGYVTDPGFVSLLGQADRDFPTLDHLQTTAEYSAPGNPVGVVLKGILVARAAYTCNGLPVVTIGQLSSQPPLDFTQIASTDPLHSATVTLATAMPALPPWGAGLLAALLASVALVVCGRAPIKPLRP
jgi:ABC-type amino acid transport substrate-binding protein